MQNTETPRHAKLLPGAPIVPRVNTQDLKYISGTDAAKRLGITKPTLIKEANEGHINAHLRRGRYLFTEPEVEEYMLRNMTRRASVAKRLEL